MDTFRSLHVFQAAKDAQTGKYKQPLHIEAAATRALRRPGLHTGTRTQAFWSTTTLFGESREQHTPVLRGAAGLQEGGPFSQALGQTGTRLHAATEEITTVLSQLQTRATRPDDVGRPCSNSSPLQTCEAAQRPLSGF